MYNISELSFGKKLFNYQKKQIITLLICFAGVGLAEWIKPSFFNYPYFSWSVNLNEVLFFWPLFVYAFIGALLSCFAIVEFREKNEILRLNIITSVLAGIWEEIGYRAIFIFYAMLSIAFWNFLWGIGSGVFLAIPGIIFVAIGVAAYNDNTEVLGVISFCIGLVLGFWGLFYGVEINLVYWFYNNIIIPIISFTTPQQFNSVIHGNHEPLFIFGAILANSWFRDGHKYQGLLGIINSWFIGLVMLYATVTYGLLVAIILHSLYDIEIGVVRYLYRLLNDD